MKEEPVTDPMVRQFLLGKVDEEERQRIESLFITDPEIKERILAAEQELIDDYLDDRLTGEDRELFLLMHGATPAQQRRLRIAKSINDWIDTSTEESRPQPTVSTWERLVERFRFRPIVVIPAVATAVIAIVLALLWINATLDRRDQERAAREPRIARPKQVQGPSQALTLSPVSVRSAESPNELLKRSDVQNVELHLAWIQPDRYPVYRAILRRVGYENPLTAGDIKPEDDGTVVLNVPARGLTRGEYQVELTGIAPDGATGPAAVYRFTVRE